MKRSYAVIVLVFYCFKTLSSAGISLNLKRRFHLVPYARTRVLVHGLEKENPSIQSFLFVRLQILNETLTVLRIRVLHVIEINIQRDHARRCADMARRCFVINAPVEFSLYHQQRFDGRLRGPVKHE